MAEIKENVSLSLDKKVIDKLDAKAKKNRRSRSFIANDILIAGLDWSE